MNLYLISQSYNRDYDTYDSAVVVAENSEIAKRMHPHTGKLYTRLTMFDQNTWTSPEHVEVEYLGKANNINERKVICASFNSG